MPKLLIIKVRKLTRVLEKLGFFKYHQVGSHAQFKHLDGRKITVPMHAGKDIGKKMIKGIISDLDLSVEKFIKLLKK